MRAAQSLVVFALVVGMAWPGAQAQDPNISPTPGWAPEFRRDIQVPGRERVALRTDWGDNLLDEAAATFGVPFGRGALPDASRARLVDAQGRNVPAEFRPTATWGGPDGPVRWALVTARLRRGQEYYIEYGSEVRRPAPQGLRVAENAREIAVDTGPMRFAIRKDAPTVVHSAYLGGEAIVTPEDAAQALPSITDGQGNVYEASAEGLQVEVVESGPMRAAVRREGWYVGADGTRFCQFITYTYFRAGEAGFRHDHTMVVAFDTNQHQIRDVEIPLPLNLQGERRAWFAADGSPGGALIEQSLGAEPISLIEHYRNGWQLLRGDERLAQGERSGGWFGMADSRWGAFAGVEHFWQNSPAELEAAGNRLNVHLWASRETELLDLRPSRILGDRGEEYPGDRIFAGRWYRDGLDEMTQGYGVGKTHSLHYRFFEAAGRSQAAQEARTVNKPVLAFADPVWACKTEAFGRVHHRAPERFPAEETVLDAIVHRRLWLRERLDNYGWFHFGDFNSHLNNLNDPESVTFNHWRRWASMFYGNPNFMPLLFMRSGMRDAWDFHRANTRHITDLDIGHLDSEEFGKWKGGRYGGDGGIAHFAAEQYHVGCDNHLRFMHYDYYLNGNLRTWEVANYYVDAYAATRDLPRNRRYRGRHSGGGLRLFSEAYMATWNPEYLDIMRQFAELLYGAKEEQGVTRYDDVYMNEGKVLYYQLTGDERMRVLFLSDMSILRQRRDAHVFEDSRHTTLFGPPHAYWFTGDVGFLPFSLWQRDLAVQGTVVEGEPGHVGTYLFGGEGRASYSSTLANQMPFLMRAMADAGDDLPQPEGPALSETTGAIHFLQEEDGDIEIGVRVALYSDVARPFRNWKDWMQKVPEEDWPALALVGPGGEEVQRICLVSAATAPPRNHEDALAGGTPPDVVFIRHPADGRTGVYTLQPTSLAVPLRYSLHSSNLERWMLDAQDAAVAGVAMTPYYFAVPAGTGEFALRIKPGALRGDCAVQVFDARGRKRAEADLALRSWGTVRLDAGRPERDEAWRFTVFPNVSYGIHLDFEGVPGYVASGPGSLFAADRAWNTPVPDEAPEGDVASYRLAADLGGVPAADIPAEATVRLQSPEEGRALAEGREGTLEMWVKCHRRPDEVRDRTILALGGLRIYRRAAIGTYVTVDSRNHQTGFVLPPGRWTHLAVTWEPHPNHGLVAAVFADGVRVARLHTGGAPASEDWPDGLIRIPQGEGGLSLVGLRVSTGKRYSRPFDPPEATALRPDEQTILLWPVNAEGEAWIFGRSQAPDR